MKYLFLVIVMIFASCNQKETALNEFDKWKEEIRIAEYDFAQLAKDSGVAVAFREFADVEGVIMRNDSIIQGKFAIENFYLRSTFKFTSLAWKPDYIDVSKSGDLAYSFGKYTFSGITSAGKETSGTGIFHTVWKRQDTGKWKYVYD